MRVLLEPSVEFAKNEINLKNINVIHKALRYYQENLTKTMPQPPSHMEKEGGEKN